jgi:hypothetical protein
MNDTPDPLDELLTPSIPPARVPRLQVALLARTTSVLRRRRRWRHFGFVVALAACYAAGVLTMRLLAKPTIVEAAPIVIERVVEREQKPVQVSEKPNRPAPAEAAPTALALEWQAVESENNRAELFRRAGDRYLNDENDPESALRCYKNALNAGADPKVSPDDNWLLTSIKNAQQEEKRHANNDG